VFFALVSWFLPIFSRIWPFRQNRGQIVASSKSGAEILFFFQNFYFFIITIFEFQATRGRRTEMRVFAAFFLIPKNAENAA